MRKSIIYSVILSVAVSSTIYAQSNKKGKHPNKVNVIEKTVVVDSTRQPESIQTITERVVESTYKNYPQQSGQPTIIINNIILPPNYQKEEKADPSIERQETIQETPAINAGQDDAEYQAWLRERRYRQQEFMMDNRLNTGQNQGNANNYQGTENYDNSKLTFQDRFGEGKKRNSGTWVIPTFGLHASAFDANFKDDEINGRAGWNAGLDYRIRTKRFFVQPGIHYFNSSMEISQKDSLSQKTFTDGPRVHSLKVPLLLGVYLTKANSGFFKFNVKGGIVGNYLLAVDKSTQTDFGKDNLNEYSYGANAGIGLEFGFITLDISHEWGITKFIKTSSKNNNILRATIGFKL
tara:strand:+ start:721 stop:1770 length:1050 start_codon:yes stop_codon:yes gene_type:complete